jgi:hypothetical protein
LQLYALVASVNAVLIASVSPAPSVTASVSTLTTYRLGMGENERLGIALADGLLIAPAQSTDRLKVLIGSKY